MSCRWASWEKRHDSTLISFHQQAKKRKQNTRAYYSFSSLLLSRTRPPPSTLETCFGGFPIVVARVTSPSTSRVVSFRVFAAGPREACRVSFVLFPYAPAVVTGAECNVFELKVGRRQTRPLAGDAQPTGHMGQPQNGKRRSLIARFQALGSRVFVFTPYTAPRHTKPAGQRGDSQTHETVGPRGALFFAGRPPAC